uniref:Uncharacterized protein n=1 Tax=Kalanchoe fedtschenkoi TaxID=63787 RepID=A0A7N0UZ07_KALFE
MGLYATMMDSITAYTGLSPAAFFTILAIMFVAYKVVSGMFVTGDDHQALQRRMQAEYRLLCCLCSWVMSLRWSSELMMGLTLRSLSSWPSKDRSTTSLVPGCYMVQGGCMPCLSGGMLAGHWRSCRLSHRI